MLGYLARLDNPDYRQEMLAFKCNMSAHAFEEATQHEFESFSILDRLATANRQQNFGHLARKAFVFDVFGAQSPGSSEHLEIRRSHPGSILSHFEITADVI